MAHRRHRPRSGCGGRGERSEDALFDQAYAHWAEAWEREKGTSPTWLDLMDEDHGSHRRGRRRRGKHGPPAAPASRLAGTAGCGGRGASRQDKLFDEAWAELAEAWEKERGVPLTWLDVMKEID